MPTVTHAQRHKLNRDPVTDAHIILLEFQEDGQTAIERAALNNENIVRGGNTYYRSDIEAQLPGTDDGDIGAQLVTPNTDRYISRALDRARERINVRMIVVDTSALEDDPLEDTLNLMVMPFASASEDGTVSAQLGARAGLQEPVTNKKTTRREFPGVWLA